MDEKFRSQRWANIRTVAVFEGEIKVNWEKKKTKLLRYATAKSLQSCPTLCPQLTRLPRPWDSPGKNTGVGCHFLLQCMKVKSESEVAQSCLTPSDPMDCSLPGSSVHGIFQARGLEWGAPVPFPLSHISHVLMFSSHTWLAATILIY